MDNPDEQSHLATRKTMVQKQIERRGIKNPAVLAAMRAVPRHRFVPKDYLRKAYEDTPLPIGHGQTISQPYMVACMSELLRLPDPGADPDTRVLEIGTGCGYQTAILAHLAPAVYSIEVLPELARSAACLLADVDCIRLRCGDGFSGWPEAAPFDAILVAAAPPAIPPPLLAQLKIGGRLVIPVGENQKQHLIVVERTATGWEQQNILPVRFVPMIGEALSD